MENEIMGLNYSTSIPLSWATLDERGQFAPNDYSHNKWLYYNYSKNIVLVFRVFVLQGENKYFDLEEMKKSSSEIQINKKNIIQSEFFKFEKGDKYNWDMAENSISLEKKENKFIPVRVTTFDLKTFMEIWYELDVKEIPVSQTKYNEIGKKNKK